jgi:hypothetical protein
MLRTLRKARSRALRAAPIDLACAKISANKCCRKKRDAYKYDEVNKEVSLSILQSKKIHGPLNEATVVKPNKS